MSSPTATVRVRVSVEVAISSTWGADCPLGQIHKQGVDEARNAVAKVLSSDLRFRLLENYAVDMVVRCEPTP